MCIFLVLCESLVQKIKMAPLLLVAALAFYTCSVEGQSSCSTPSGAGGSCISIYDCRELVTIVNKPNKSQQDIQLLRSSHCGFDANVPKVCCPAQTQNSTCFTPDGWQGACVGISSCQHLADMLKAPVSKDTVAFMQKFRCKGTEKHSVCCGPPPGPTAASVPAFGVCKMTAEPPDPNTWCCGEAASGPDRFSIASETAIDQYPWLALIEYSKNDSISLRCGGALISGRFVLTAGHCVVGPLVLDAGTPKNVRLGEYDTSNDGLDCVEVPGGGGLDCTEGLTVIPIEEVIPHPQYDPSASHRRNDIALLRLRQLAPYTDFIRPICLPTTDVTPSPPSSYRYLTVAGWGTGNNQQSAIGKINRKTEASLQFASPAECQQSDSGTGENATQWQGQLCAGGGHKDPCKGDPGGPLMFELQRHTEVVGVASFGPTHCDTNSPAVYTNVYEYNAWIRLTIGRFSVGV